MAERNPVLPGVQSLRPGGTQDAVLSDFRHDLSVAALPVFSGEPEPQGVGYGVLLRDVPGDGKFWAEDDALWLHLPACAADCPAPVQNDGSRAALGNSATVLR